MSREQIPWSLTCCHEDGYLRRNLRRRPPSRAVVPRFGPGDDAHYGHTTIHGTQVRVHRWVYEILVGPIPGDHVLHHTCETKRCVNPAHLEPLTPSEHAAVHAALRRRPS